MILLLKGFMDIMIADITAGQKKLVPCRNWASHTIATHCSYMVSDTKEALDSQVSLHCPPQSHFKNYITIHSAIDTNTAPHLHLTHIPPVN